MSATTALADILGVEIDIKVVDLGANPIDGTPPYRPLMNSARTEIVGFEPDHAALAKLNRMKGSRETYLPHVVGDGKRRRLRICQASGMTSLFEPDPEVLALFHGFPDWGRVLAVEDVNTIRLDDVPETAGVHYIKLDIQGAELMALQNAVKRLAGALVIHTEVEFLPLYKGQPLFSEIEVYLRKRKFILHRFAHQESRTLQPMLINDDIRRGLSQIVWGDAVFVRDLTKLADLPARDLLRFAAILHDCYQSWDAAFKVIRESDRRAGTALGERYLDAVRQTIAKRHEVPAHAAEELGTNHQGSGLE